MTDAWADFDEPVPEPRHGRTTKARVTTANPRSQNAADPYVDLIEEGYAPFRVKDLTSSVFGYSELIEVHEISHSLVLDRYAGYGPRVLRGGGLASRPEYVLVLRADMPDDLVERLRA